jgi:hypothetical protein
MTSVMTATTPDWLSLHGGELRPGLSDRVWMVLFNGTVQYRLNVIPAKGKFTCAVTQGVNSKRLDPVAEQVTADDALRAGLDQLRLALGW